MSHLWTNADFKQELTHLAALHNRKPGSPVVQNMATSWCVKIHAVTSWNSTGILELMNHLDTLVLADDLKSKLNACLEELTIGSSQAVKVIKAGQLIHNLPAYISAADWAKLEATATLYDHMHVIAQRLVAMSVISLRENTKAQGVALSLYCQSQLGKPEPNAMTIHNCLNDFQALHKQCLAEMKEPPAAPIRVYPSNPQDLGATWLQQVYGQDSLPGKQVPMAAWLQKVACRSSNKMLQGSQVAKGSKTDTIAEEKTAKEMLQELLAKHEKPAQVTFATSGTCSTESLAQQRPVATPQASVLSNANEKHLLPEEQKVPSNDVDQVPGTNSKSKAKDLEAMEEEAFNQLQEKPKVKGMKRPASKMDMAAAKHGAAKQKTFAKGKAKPAAKTTAKNKTEPKKKGKARLPGMGPGCSKCRGDGCSTCGKPGFCGQIYPGRAAWQGYFGKPK